MIIGAGVVGSGNTDWLSIVLTWGPPGVVLAMIMLGLLVTKRERVALENDRDNWRGAFDTERAAHVLTREALAEANVRASAALESANTMTRILEAGGHSRTPGHQ